jgi:LPS-assembly lipoprotein
VGNIKDAGVVIKVVNEKLRRNVLSLSSSGRAREYELYYTLDFLLLDNKGQILTETQPIEIIRDYFNNQEELLGKYNEEQVIRAEMYKQAVRSMLNRSRIALEKIIK